MILRTYQINQFLVQAIANQPWFYLKFANIYLGLCDF